MITAKQKLILRELVDFRCQMCNRHEHEVGTLENMDGDYDDSAYEKEPTHEENEGIQIGLCKTCNKYFFTGLYGSWHCRNCGTHDGDHPIFAMLYDGDIEEIDFVNINSIKEWLNSHSIKTNCNVVFERI